MFIKQIYTNYTSLLGLI